MPVRPIARKARILAAAFGLAALLPVGAAQAATARSTVPATNAPVTSGAVTSGAVTNAAVTAPAAAVTSLTAAGALLARAMLVLGREAASPLLLHPMSSRFPVGAATR